MALSAAAVLVELCTVSARTHAFASSIFARVTETPSVVFQHRTSFEYATMLK